MGMNVDMHVGDDGITIESRSYTQDPEGEYFKFVVADIKVKDAQLRLFLRHIGDVDKLAFEFESLARSLREQYRELGEKGETK